MAINYKFNFLYYYNIDIFYNIYLIDINFCTGLPLLQEIS